MKEQILDSSSLRTVISIVTETHELNSMIVPVYNLEFSWSMPGDGTQTDAKIPFVLRRHEKSEWLQSAKRAPKGEVFGGKNACVSYL